MKCIRGQRIATEGLAERAATSSRSRRHLRPYHCDLCGDWHLTSTSPGKHPRCADCGHTEKGHTARAHHGAGGCAYCTCRTVPAVAA